MFGLLPPGVYSGAEVVPCRQRETGVGGGSALAQDELAAGQFNVAAGSRFGFHQQAAGVVIRGAGEGNVAQQLVAGDREQAPEAALLDDLPEADGEGAGILKANAGGVVGVVDADQEEHATPA